MSKARMNLPQAFLSSTTTIEDSYLAARLSLLNLYTDARIKGEWSTYFGMFKNVTKSAIHGAARFFALGKPKAETLSEDPVAITAINDTICRQLVINCNNDKAVGAKEKALLESVNASPEEIEALKSLKEACYRRSCTLIQEIKKYAEEAQGSSSQQSLRVSYYFAIIGLTQEYLRLRFPEESARNLEELNKRLIDTDKEYYTQHASGQPVKTLCDTANQILIDLVLLGERKPSILGRVFHPSHTNLFPYLSFATPDKVSTSMTQLVNQLKLEEGHSNPFLEYEALNANLPLPLQRFSPRLLIIECGFESVEAFLRQALLDKALMQSRTSLHSRYLKTAAPVKAPRETDYNEESPDAAAAAAAANPNTPPPAANAASAAPAASVAPAVAAAQVAAQPPAAPPPSAQAAPETVHIAAAPQITEEEADVDVLDLEDDEPDSPGMSHSPRA